MHQIVLISTALLLGFALLGVMDGVYFHFWKHKLPTHPASRYEHKLHTLRAVAFPFIIYFLYAHNFGGLYLWLGAFFAGFDLIILGMDVVAEFGSRESLGGLPRTEYLIHIFANGFHFASIALILSIKPVSAWNYSSQILLDGSYPWFTVSVANVLITGGILVALTHIGYWWQYRGLELGGDVL
jgi:hypothetical protein